METIKPPVYLVDDAGNDLIIAVKTRAGVAVDLTGATAATLGCVGENGERLSLSGSLLVAASGTVNCGPPGAENSDAYPTEIGKDVLFTGYLSYTKSGVVHKSTTPAHFIVRKWL